MVANGQNQMTILVADSSYASSFLDRTRSRRDRARTSISTRPAGRSAGSRLDCVAWGSFERSARQALPAAPAARHPRRHRPLRRTIAPGCATLLEASDDHDNSASGLRFPRPPHRARTRLRPSERGCGGSDGGGRRHAGTPSTAMARRRRRCAGKPPKRSRDRTPTFRFAAERGRRSTFECQIDSKPFRPCRSPFTVKAPLPGPAHLQGPRPRRLRQGSIPPRASYAFKVLPRH